MRYVSLAILALLMSVRVKAQELIIIDQDYDKALWIASKEKKLILVDFYTTWCVPCKKLDRLVLQNDSIQTKLAADFVLLKYDAEKDSVFNLSKKHHVMSYPTGLILDRKGFVLGRKYGFPGEGFPELSIAYLEFADGGVEAARQSRQLPGYSPRIDISVYPAFYTNYVNRTATEIDSAIFQDYWNAPRDMYSEEFFSTLIYFAREKVPAFIGDSVLKNKQQYERLYGKTDVEVLLYFLSSSRFEEAIAALDQEEFDAAARFMDEALGQRYMEEVLPSFRKDFLKKQGRWAEVFRMNEDQKKAGSFSDDAVNYFCWDVYKNCDDREVIANCLSWMRELTTRKPEFAYLDTYSFLLFKSGNRQETRRVAKLAIEAAVKEKESTKKLEEMLKSL